METRQWDYSAEMSLDDEQLVVAMAVEAVGMTRPKDNSPRSDHRLVLMLLGSAGISPAVAGFSTKKEAKSAITQANRTGMSRKQTIANFQSAKGVLTNNLLSYREANPEPTEPTEPTADQLIELAELFANYRNALKYGRHADRQKAEDLLLARYDGLIEGHINQVRWKEVALDTAMDVFYNLLITADLSQREFADLLDESLSQSLQTRRQKISEYEIFAAHSQTK